MNRINAIMVYTVIILWTGIVLLHGISGIRLNARPNGKESESRIVTTKHVSPAPWLDHRSNSLTPLYY